MDSVVASKNSVLDNYRMLSKVWTTLFVVGLAAFIVVKWILSNQVAWVAVAMLGVYFVLVVVHRFVRSPLKTAARRAVEESVRTGQMPVPLGPTRLWLDEDGVHISNEWGSGVHFWRSVREVDDLGDVYRLEFQFGIQTVLPKRAFSPQDSMDEFIEAVRSRAAPPTRRTGPSAA